MIPEHDLSAPTTKPRIGVFGGTFDPPHSGHLALAHAAREHLNLHEVILVPAHQNPAKSPAGRSSARHRLEMTRLAVQGELGLAVSDIDVSRPGPSYTVETLTEFTQTRSGHYWFILGADALAGFNTWKDPDRIVRLARLAVAARPGIDMVRVTAHLPEHVVDRLDVLPFDPVDVSSSALREAIHKWMSPELQIKPAVLDYIRTHRLYADL